MATRLTQGASYIKKRFDRPNYAIARAFEEVGHWWKVLIVRVSAVEQQPALMNSEGG